MLLSIISIVINFVYLYILNLDIYTDRAMFPNGDTRTWQRSAIERLNLSGESYYFFFQLLMIIICIISSLLRLFGFKNSIIKIVQIASLIISTIIFIIIMIVTNNRHAKYA